MGEVGHCLSMSVQIYHLFCDKLIWWAYSTFYALWDVFVVVNVLVGCCGVGSIFLSLFFSFFFGVGGWGGGAERRLFAYLVKEIKNGLKSIFLYSLWLPAYGDIAGHYNTCNIYVFHFSSITNFKKRDSECQFGPVAGVILVVTV